MNYSKAFGTDFYFERQPLIDTQIITGGHHYHGNFEIYYLTRGECWYFIDKKSVKLTAGDIALIPEGVIHKTNYETSKRSRILIHCSPEFIPHTVKELIPKMPYFAKTSQTQKAIEKIIDSIEAEYLSPDEFSYDALKSKLADLLILIARGNKISDHEKTESPVVEKAVSYIKAHYASGVTLKDVADYCFVSREHLSRTFKRETGFGFNEYLTVYRLKKAESILKTNPKSKISEVALSCGFNDSNYFSKIYKKMYNVSPMETKILSKGDVTFV